MFSFVQSTKKKIKETTFYKYYLKHIIYNKCAMRLLGALNRVRWKKINLLIILWPPAAGVFEQIIEELKIDLKILKETRFHINKKYFKKFVNELYIIDHAGPDKISRKIDRLSESSHKLVVIHVEILNPKLLVQDALNNVRCENIGNIKDNIRQKFKSEIRDYVYDVIIHSTEVDYQNRKVMHLLKKYGTRCD